MMCVTLPPNNVGKDFVVGDIHGCYDILLESLAKIGFDYSVDRLFALGDLVDRGTKSLDMVFLIGKPWFYSVRGNHEQWAIDNYTDQTFQESARSHSTHGGLWFYSLDDEWMGNVARKFQTLPLMIETVVDGKTVGFAHAETGDWDTTRYLIKDLVESDITGNHTAQKILWSRTRIKDKNGMVLKGIDHIFYGHTPVYDPVLLGNTTFMDTGAVFPGGKMTILNIKDYLKNID